MGRTTAPSNPASAGGLGTETTSLALKQPHKLWILQARALIFSMRGKVASSQVPELIHGTYSYGDPFNGKASDII
jgi:hypothetical protein